MATTSATYATYVTHQSSYQVRVSAFDLVTQAYHVSIFRATTNDDGEKIGFESLACLEYQATKLFVGFRHHIVVMCVNDRIRQYVSVDNQIRMFKCLAPIDNMISDTYLNYDTNSVYVSLVDLAGNVYLIHENVVLRKPPQLDHIDGDDDYYEWYYRHVVISERTLSPNGLFSKPAVIHGFMNIAEFFVKNRKFNLRYTAFPEQEYTRIMTGKDTTPAVPKVGFPNDMAVRIGSKYHRMDKQKYIRLHKAYGKLMHFQGLKTDILDGD